MKTYHLGFKNRVFSPFRPIWLLYGLVFGPFWLVKTKCGEAESLTFSQTFQLKLEIGLIRIICT